MKAPAKLRALRAALFALALLVMPLILRGSDSKRGSGNGRGAESPDDVFTADARITRLALSGHRAEALAAFEALPRSASGVHAPIYPLVALAYDLDGQPARAYSTLESLRNLIMRRVGYLQRSPSALRATLVALADAAPRFTSPDARDLAADILARAGYKPQA